MSLVSPIAIILAIAVLLLAVSYFRITHLVLPETEMVKRENRALRRFFKNIRELPLPKQVAILCAPHFDFHGGSERFSFKNQRGKIVFALKPLDNPSATENLADAMEIEFSVFSPKGDSMSIAEFLGKPREADPRQDMRISVPDFLALATGITEDDLTRLMNFLLECFCDGLSWLFLRDEEKYRARLEEATQGKFSFNQ
jgi:hypothetical protein